MPETESSPDALARAIALHRQGDLTGAEAGYREVLAREPRNASALNLLGVLIYQLGGTADAIKRIQHSLEIAPRQAGAYINLGRIYAETEQWEEAARCFEQVVTIDPEHGVGHRSLAHALVKLDRQQEALAHYGRALAIDPSCAESRLHRATSLERMHRLDEAIAEAREVLQQDPDSVVAYRLLGRLLRKGGRLQEAYDTYDRWLSVDPENAVALHFKAACGGREIPVHASDEYVRQEFDRFADEFEESLRNLDYRAPELIAESLAHQLDPPTGNMQVLDVGCGTGLCGRKLRPYAAELTGVDLSPGMLEVARGLELYDKLHEAELTGFLATCNGDYDLITSADTLNYLGDLGPALRGAEAALRPGGLLIFTVEQWLDGEEHPGEEHPSGDADNGYFLHRFGRYAHRAGYVGEQLEAAGLQVVEINEKKLRMEAGLPVAGLLAIARRPPE